MVDADCPLIGDGEPPLTAADVDAGRIRGCNQIRCRDCGQIVKQIPHVVWRRPAPVGAILRAAYASDTLATCVEPRPDLTVRVYACECRSDNSVGIRSFDDLWDDYAHPWSCHGH